VFIGALRNGEGNASGAGGNDTFTGIEDVRAGSGNDSVKGDLLANNLSGGAGNDTLLGDGGDDTLTGGTGNDSLNGGNDVDWVSYADRIGAVTVNLTTGRASGAGGADSLSGIENVLTGAGNDNVTGSSLDNIISAGTGNDTLIGNGGNDTISGGLGNDSLNGGTGTDHFIFDTALGTTNVDRIQSYNVTDDTILLDDAIFTALGSPGALAAGAFKAGTAATDADDRIIFNAATGALFYDQDGNGAAAAVQFATLTSITGTITNADFLII
jgi:serralysin